MRVIRDSYPDIGISQASFGQSMNMLAHIFIKKSAEHDIFTKFVHKIPHLV